MSRTKGAKNLTNCERYCRDVEKRLRRIEKWIAKKQD